MHASARWSRVAIASRLLAAAALLFVAPPVAAQGGADLATARKCFEDIWVRHDTTAVARCNAPSYPEHGTAGDTVATHASTYAFLRSVFTDYPDMKGTVVEQLPHGDRIITRWRVVGTNKNTKKQLAMSLRQPGGTPVAGIHDHAAQEVAARHTVIRVSSLR